MLLHQIRMLSILKKATRQNLACIHLTLDFRLLKKSWVIFGAGINRQAIGFSARAQAPRGRVIPGSFSFQRDDSLAAWGLADEYITEFEGHFQQPDLALQVQEPICKDRIHERYRQAYQPTSSIQEHTPCK
uniref:Uncharacterized protein n=1 Tax=Candidatus Kentrum sp. LPFa TaxID=2126335 RepID=A0A450Y2A4_9GAMM|nr:MAG: hypothetical protein BECKLPF1236A_GA0070988_103612 [Candidatus Kentron sp. LPFa]VFK35670.1 MAG: hypothetical protein BECKLPF1236C_GA0070990_104063 [Candidatus Kentron sp. LPFa]